MKVREAKEVTEVERAPASAVSAPHRPPADKVSVEEVRRTAELVASARQNANTTRSLRLQEVEAALRAGQYRPDAARIADQILSAAEVDARLRALLQRG
jgi:anti-sigma28 factor (negative regulator of flagellin synthesis)